MTKGRTIQSKELTDLHQANELSRRSILRGAAAVAGATALGAPLLACGGGGGDGGDPPAPERAAAVRALTGGRGADIVIEAAGPPEAVSDALDMVRDDGRVVIAGQYTDHGPVALEPHRQINRKHVEIRGSWGSDFSHFYRSIELQGLHHHRYPWREMITRVYPLERAGEALEAVRRRDVVKAAIDPTAA